jgi:hypothetical protein
MPTVTAARSIACIREATPGLRSAFFDHLAKRPFDFRKGCTQRRAARIEDNVPLRPEFGAVEAKSLPQPALDTIAHNRSPDGSWNGEAETGAFVCRGGTRQAERGEKRAGDAGAFVIDQSKVSGAQNPGRPGKLSWRSRTGRLSRR